MKYRINYSKVISQADSIAEDATQLSAQIKLLTQMEQKCRSTCFTHLGSEGSGNADQYGKGKQLTHLLQSYPP